MEEREAGACRQQRNVHVFDIEYFFPAVDTSEYDRLQAAIRQCEPGGDHCLGDCCDVCEYGGGGGVL